MKTAVWHSELSSECQGKSLGTQIHHPGHKDGTRKSGGTDTHQPPQARSPRDPRRDNRTPPRAAEASSRRPPAATTQKTQGAAATSPRAPPATRYARVDPAMDRETRAPRAHHPPSWGPPEPGHPGPSKQPTGRASRYPGTQPQTRATHAPAGRGTNHQWGVQVTSPKGEAYPWTQEMVLFSLGWRRADSPTLRRRGKVAHEPRREPGATSTTPVQPPAPTPSRDRPGRVHPVPTPSRDRPGRVHPVPMSQPASQSSPRAKQPNLPASPNSTPQTPLPCKTREPPKGLPPTSAQTPNTHSRTQTPQRWALPQEGPRSEEPARVHPTSESPAHCPHFSCPTASHPQSHNKPQQQGNSPARYHPSPIWNCNQAGTTEPHNHTEPPTQYNDRTDSAAKHPRQEARTRGQQPPPCPL
ncbi:extensin-like [Kryptolebias marmoratus]|uniref:extensin-like n=1 Tax=Kryptolebias marmoratus TaxID=37003 RepID=UPI0007F8B119|nr:extensin-like [Kryptolebias marmoratus]